MITGVITSREIIKNPYQICRGFGVGVFLRCLWVAFTRRSQTFLEIMQPHLK